ncbi:hypothetical protein IF2G_05178 [Cordyceps javanica]|nr:hypothetical protein IF2G_05178 [Cordyceps javanica]
MRPVLVNLLLTATTLSKPHIPCFPKSSTGWPTGTPDSQSSTCLVSTHAGTSGFRYNCLPLRMLAWGPRPKQPKPTEGMTRDNSHRFQPPPPDRRVKKETG